MNNGLINKRIAELKQSGMNYAEISRALENENIYLSRNAVEIRFRRNNKGVEKKQDPSREVVQYNADGTVEAEVIVNLTTEMKNDHRAILKAMGYNPNNWEIMMLQISNWQQHTKSEGTKSLYAIKCKLKPKTTLTEEDSINTIMESFKKKIAHLDIQHTVSTNEELDSELLLEYPPLELHLGKLAHADETGEDYDSRIAKEVFKYSIEETIREQAEKRCGTLLYVVGSDFFNSDTPSMTTTKGTPQFNDSRWKKMFSVGLELHIQAINELSKHFNHVDVMLTSGNHCEMAIYYLYMALAQYFKENTKVHFRENYKDTQCYEFGDCAIFFNHGDSKLDRLKKSIPVEFYEEWGRTLYRELHLGHFHKEIMYDDDSGLITRRIGSPSGTDEWHYKNRFMGATKRHQVFVWKKDSGLLNTRYITFKKHHYCSK